MSPFYEDSHAVLYQGDCLALLAELEPHSVDMVLADPPYGETSLEWDVRDVRWMFAAQRVLKPTGSLWCFGSLRMFRAQAADVNAMGWKLAQDLVWEKHNGSSFHADRFKRVHELSAQFYMGHWETVYKKPVTVPDAIKRSIPRRQKLRHTGDIGAHHYRSEDGGDRLMRSVVYERSCHGHADHPTQKPLGILRALIEYSCPPGGLVLDPTCGAGSALVAAKQLGCRSIGFEMTEEHCTAAARRLSQELAFG